MEFDPFLDQAWTDHADDAAAVAARLITPGLGLLHQEDQVLPLAQLAQHLHGAHLGHWAEGVAFQDLLAGHPLVAAGSTTAAAVQRFRSVLRLAGRIADDRVGQSTSDHVRLTALAAGALAAHDATRAQALLQEALDGAEAGSFADNDPAVRALAITGNLIAGTLEDLATRTDAERGLMVLGAQTGRRFWARAGTWLEVERAEYRLAKTWVKAGDAAQARAHAQQCLDTVKANDGAALEVFFAWEALGVAHHAADNSAALAQAVAEAETAFSALGTGDQGWCRPSLAALQALGPTALQAHLPSR